MTVLLEIKEKIMQIFGRYSSYILPVLKFLLAFFVFFNINHTLGYLKLLDNIFILLIISLLCAILPLNTIVVFGGIMIIAHTFTLGMEIGAVTLIFFTLMYLLYFRIVPKDALAFVLAPAACSIGMPCAVPMGLGLLREPVSAVSACMGTVTFYYIQVIKDVVEPLKEAKEQNLLENIQALIGGVLENREMFVVMVAGAAVVIIMALIRKFSIDYAWYIAIALGAACYILLAVGGAFFLQADFSVGGILLGTLGSCVIALILELFCFHVDYKKTEFLQYQDDTYVYYVKAVPKIAVDGKAEKIRNRAKGTYVREQSGRAERDYREHTKEGQNLQGSPTAANLNWQEEEQAVTAFSEIDLAEKLEESLKHLR